MGRICIRIYSTVSAIRGEIELKRKVMSCRQKSLGDLMEEASLAISLEESTDVHTGVCR